MRITTCQFESALTTTSRSSSGSEHRAPTSIVDVNLLEAAWESRASIANRCDGVARVRVREWRRIQILLAVEGRNHLQRMQDEDHEDGSQSEDGGQRRRGGRGRGNGT